MIPQTKELKWHKMTETFRKEILTGVYPVGQRLPSDDIIAKTFCINKRTVANGMSQLVAEGLITRAPGRGSVVIRKEIISRHTNAVSCMTFCKGEIYENMESEITEQALKRGFYPVWIPPSLYTLGIKQFQNKQLYQFFEHSINSMPHGMVVNGERFIPYDMLERNLAKVGRLVFVCNYTHIKELPAKYVLIDYEDAANKVVSLFLSKGHKKMTFITSPIPNIDKYKNKPPQYQYHLELKKACHKMGLEYDEEIPKRLWNGVEVKETFQLLKQKNITAGALCFDSILKVHYKNILEELNLKIPEDLSVIGFYDTDKENITSLNIQERLLASLAMEMLFEDCNETKKVYVQPVLIERNSVISI
jgi:DNA-binding LacI/PurR family transcriptional regulator